MVVVLEEAVVDTGKEEDMMTTVKGATVVMVETLIVCAVMVDNCNQIQATVGTVLVEDTQAVPVVVELRGEVAKGF